MSIRRPALLRDIYILLLLALVLWKHSLYLTANLFAQKYDGVEGHKQYPFSSFLKISLSVMTKA